ncbi:hypothetical protein L6654_40370 [Bradyrhizobium sp. WYCCWR 13023]|uniref:DUF433 domain-containing protein n=1 Tax=Bradyrhizobium zhengyangense TaxID=2911009 RepID=A0A9X1RK35_9BRAD|nr:hypothetical protein [Bradyrhizobium zhengyangense]MCG2632847.1 hypothetical protein [Bradyrhizobium zhengyangense]
MKQDLSMIGLGLYSPSEAAALTNVPAPRIRRWLTGHQVGEKTYPALWRSQLEKFEVDGDQLYLSFLDLVQLRVADAFIREGVSAQKVRRAVEYGSKIVASDYPFASARFRTDGRTIVLHVLQDDGDEKLIDLFKSGQYLMQKVIEPSLKNLEFNEADIATRWWPLGKNKGVVVDPARQFGQPIDDASGVPTSVLAEAVQAEGSEAKAAKRYMVPVASVHRAVAFQQKLAA